MIDAGRTKVPVEVRVTRLSPSGDGLAFDKAGGRHTVPGLLPGERAMVKVRRKIRGKFWSQVVEVTDPSPMRITPPCPSYRAGCGGCQLQHLAVDDQRALKLGLVQERLVGVFGEEAAGLVDVRSLAPWHFRTSLRVAVDRSGAAGFRKRKTHHVLGGAPCDVAHPLLVELLTDVSYPGAEEVILRCGDRTGERLAVATPSIEIPNLPPDVARDAISEFAADRTWRVSAKSFFQSRPDAIDEMATLVADAAGEIDGPSLAVDLYAGVGIFAGVLADQGWSVTAVESSPSSVADARANLARDAVRVVHGDVDAWTPTRASFVVADPNRIGAGSGGVAAITRTGAARVVLVSCDVTGLANDAQLLSQAGYSLTRSTFVDVFPHTFHVEVVSIFDRTG